MTKSKQNAPNNINKPPPINIIGASLSQINTIFNKLKLTGYEVKLTAQCTKVFNKTNDSFKIMKNALSEEKIQFFTHRLRDEQLTKVVLHELPKAEENDVKTAIENIGLQPVQIKKMTIKQIRYESHAVYLVYFKKLDKIKVSELNENYNIVESVRVKWDIYKNKNKGPTQCRNCQRFGHGSDNCSATPRCVRCAANHKSSDCPFLYNDLGEKIQNRINSVNLKCVHCQQQHAASSRDCPLLNTLLMNKTNSNLRILYWNTNGIKNKIYELYQYANSNYIHIICLNETFLKPNIKLPSDPNYKIYRLDRDDQAKGGIAILVRKSIKHTLLPLLNTSLIENLGVQIALDDNKSIKVYSIYLPGGTNNTDINSYYAKDIRLLISNAKDSIFCGDLNSRHKYWNCTRANRAGTILYSEYTAKAFNIDFPQEHTHYPADNSKAPSTIDLVLSSGQYDIKVAVCPELLSDHIASTFSVDTQTSIAKKEQSLQLDYSKAKWPSYRRILSENIKQLHSIQLNSHTAIDTVVEAFTDSIIEARDLSVPLTKRTPYKLNLPDYIIEKIKIKNALKCQWRRNRLPLLKREINQLEKHIKLDIAAVKNENWAFKLKTYHLTTMQFGKRLFCLKTRLVIFLRLNENANNDNQNNLSLPSLNDLCDAIKSLPNNKAPGPDQIKNCLIKQLPLNGIKLLLVILTACISLNYFPRSWKHATVFPIPKPQKDHTNPANYRPISLLSSLGKLLEKLILSHINRHCMKYNIFPETQHGFRQNYSTLHQLRRVISHAKQGLDNKLSTGLITMDIEKAFDRVWTKGLLYKMIKLKFHSSLIKLVDSFLKDRSYCVTVNGKLSDTHNFFYGVPQGAILSPILYNIYTHDSPHNNSYQTALYADDTAKYKTARKFSIINKSLITATDELAIYLQKWKISINGAKTNSLFISKRISEDIRH
ncbi:hypothetical protein PVAND_014389 [Polypedilum vanderplanki]|uniref:Reverse transcriptase domain-containing protein n=1 Tax=Polypedilum vanderplanki TaxID=319348 RepID=A0A9J6BA14_POLVA|nr:hypothetical protein PVAND_014389 [Polypedilum vanderplanki]